MKTLSLDEFQRMTSLSDTTMLWLLKQGHLPTVLSPSGSIGIDCDNLAVQDLIHAIVARLAAPEILQAPLLHERLRRAIGEELEKVVAEACHLLGKRVP